MTSSSAFGRQHQSSSPSRAGVIRLLSCDDSLMVRKIMARIVEKEPDLDVVAFAENGQDLIDKLEKDSNVDVILLDIQMPVMDGLTALKILRRRWPEIKVLMASTFTLPSAEVTIKALNEGAHDFIPKPSALVDLSQGEFARDLKAKVRALGSRSRFLRTPAPAPAQRVIAAPPRRASSQRPEIIALGASTGGPEALTTVLAGLKGMTVPIVITQHMPGTFTSVFANHLSRSTGITVKEAETGDVLMPGQALLAPGGSHMGFLRKGASVCARLSLDPPENHCRPAVDYMVRDVVSLYGARTLAVILTGIGHDGRAGCQKVVEAGGTVLAQDEASSVVWGMPKAVVDAGFAHAVMDPAALSVKVRQMVIGGAR